MPYWVYVLRSKKTKRRYIGQTDNLELRMMRHNCGMVTSTAPYHPWQLIFQEEYSTRSETMQRERFLKSGKGREFLDSIEVELAGRVRLRRINH
jgi:putative endonuclease